MQMQSCRLFWHKSTLSIVLRRELGDCVPSREVPVLHVQRPKVFGGDLDVDLGASVHPVRMLPVSGKDVRDLRFGLVYGPKRKGVRFRAPDTATYDNWEMVLEVAVEKAATERPTFPTWPYPGTSPSLSALEDGYISEEFGFSDGDGTSDESKAGELRYRPPPKPQNPMTGSFVDFMDPSSPEEERSSTEDDAGFDRVPSSESEYQACVMPLAREVEVLRPKMLPDSDATAECSSKVIVQPPPTASQGADWSSKKPLTEHPFATRLRLQLISADTSKVSIGDYFSWIRAGSHRDARERLKCSE